MYPTWAFTFSKLSVSSSTFTTILLGAGDNMHILEFHRVHSGYDEKCRYKTSGTKIMVVGQKYPPPQFREKIIFC